MTRTVVACMLVAAVVVAAFPAVRPAPARGLRLRPPAAASSRASEQDRLGTTYVISLRVSGTTCANGKKVVKAYHRCRNRNGGRDGRCRSRVFGYRCSERRLNVIPSQYDARARCKKSGREIFHKYTQNT